MKELIIGNIYNINNELYKIIEKKYNVLFIEKIIDKEKIKLKKKYKSFLKYANEYKKTTTRKMFIELCIDKYPNKKRKTFGKYFSYIKNKLGEQSKKIIYKKKYEEHEKERPTHIKMLEIEDMKRFGKKLTREYLIKYGFNTLELNWLEEEGLLNDK